MRTLPSSNVETPSARAISRTSTDLPLNWNDELRAATRSPETVQRASRISSAMPSHIQSWSLPGLMSAKGSTAMDGVAAPTVAGEVEESAGEPRCARKYQATPGTAANTPTPASTSASRVPFKPLAAGAVRSIRPAFTSKIQARLTTTGKPTASATTM